MQTTLEQLTKRIEQVIHEHMAQTQVAAMQAVVKAFAAERTAGTMLRAQPRSAKASQRRASAEIAELSEKLYEAVCKLPGESMAVLAAHLNSSAAELQMPMRRLRNEDRVRSIGAKHQTRYFPLAESS